MTRGRSRWPGARSVRFRITLVATLAVAVVLVAAGVGLVAAQQRSLTTSLEEALGQEADTLASEAAGGALSQPLDPAGDDDTVAQIVVASGGEGSGGGSVLAATPNIEGRPPLVASPARGSSTSRIDSVLERGDHFLVVTRGVSGSTDQPLAVAVGAPLDDVADSTRALARSLLVGLPMVLALLAALVWWLVGRTLRPVEAIRVRVSEIGGSDLHRRVPVPSGEDELSRLARTMNAMLDRLESSSDRQQRFVADASHELRSPLTRIRSELEVDLAHPAGADPAATHRSVLDEVDGLQHLVDDLLLLARSDGDAFASTVVDLDDLLLDEAHRAAADGPAPPGVTGATGATGVTVDSSAIEPARVMGDPRALGRALRNVIENATRHARSQVTVTLAAHDGVAVVGIADDGPGIAADRRDEVFERFARLDEARSGADGGTGLGLAIARAVVERHGGAIEVEVAATPGACLVITLPLADA